ncbi:hypothetical protein GA0074695_2473 [Micromonospora viridifaciens]|uniref:Uncharacterized protein n=1 Tax=Micromonospora viridifaciens TaxID=1881 RepID=A0A1C4WII3_MICVI|nr:hypothetical protein GA0074695_2473 [Micromonospora viridifaciens]
MTDSGADSSDSNCPTVGMDEEHNPAIEIDCHYVSPGRDHSVTRHQVTPDPPHRGRWRNLRGAR